MAAAESALLREEPKCACSKMGTTWSEKISAWRPVVMYFTTYLLSLCNGLSHLVLNLVRALDLGSFVNFLNS